MPLLVEGERLFSILIPCFLLSKVSRPFTFMFCRLFKVNGQPIFVRGGNWILSDGLLRLSEERYHTDIRFHADMNFNMIRCWGGGLAERPEFYQYCDIYGLLVGVSKFLPWMKCESLVLFD